MKRIPFKGISNNLSFPRRRESSFIKYLDSRLRGNDNKGGGRCAIKSQTGVSLVEMVAFIVIVSIAMVGLMRAYTSILSRAPTAAQLTQATQLAQERMELILAQKDVLGFESLALDPCVTSAAAICTPPAGFSITTPALGTAAKLPWPGATPSDPTAINFRLITVTVTDTQSTKQLTEVQAVLANY